MKLLFYMLLPLLLCSCYFNTLSFNNGKTLTPGNSMSTWGVAKFNTAIQERNRIGSGLYYDTTVIETTDYTLTSIVHDYRLGILAEYPFGTGLELNYHFEAYPGENSFGAVLDLSTRAGLPSFPIGKGLYNHNIGIGYTVGMWVDNGLFGEYGGGIEYRKIIPYFSIRAGMMPTIIDFDTVDDDDILKQHNMKFNARINMGCNFKLPKRAILPDIITPEVGMILNRFPDGGNGPATVFALGFQWTNGFILEDAK